MSAANPPSETTEDIDSILAEYRKAILLDDSGVDDINAKAKLEAHQKRMVLEARIDELYEAFKLNGGYYGSKDPKYSEYPASIRFQVYYDKRLAELKREQE